MSILKINDVEYDIYSPINREFPDETRSFKPRKVLVYLISSLTCIIFKK